MPYGLIFVLSLIAALVVAYRYLGDYMFRAVAGTTHSRVERAVYRLVGVNPSGEQSWAVYACSVLAFSAVFGFGGSIISLLMSKSMAKWSTGAHVIESPRSESEAWLLTTVKKLADKAGVAMPEVAVYEGEANAFATGAFRNSALVAVSSGLLGSMSRDEVEAVLGHEIAHVANGDMVTLALIQGVVNTFVVFLARVVAFFVDRIVFRTERGSGPGYYITMIVCQLLLGILASLIVAWFSRRREFRAPRARCPIRRPCARCCAGC